MVQSDQGDEYLFAEFDKHLLDNEILSQLSTPGMPQQNGMVERRKLNMALLDMVKSIMSYSDLLGFPWGYALEMAAYILNSLLTKSVPNTLVELWTGSKPRNYEAISDKDSEN